MTCRRRRGHRAARAAPSARSRARSSPTTRDAPPATSTLVLLATDRAGWANLTRLITAGRRRCDKGESLVSWREVCAARRRA